MVFPSLWEGTPLTVFEALAMGKPIVATDADGLLDVLTDRQDALIVPKRDAAALAQAVCMLIEQPQLAAALAAGARTTGAHYDIRPSSARWSGSTSCYTRPRARPGVAGVLQADLSFLASERMTIDQPVARTSPDAAWRGVWAPRPPRRLASC